MDSNSPSGRHKLGPQNRTGDVDRDGEIVDLADVLTRRARESAAYQRLAAAVCDESTIDVDRHLAAVVGELRRVKR